MGLSSRKFGGTQAGAVKPFTRLLSERGQTLAFLRPNGRKSRYGWVTGTECGGADPTTPSPSRTV